MGLGRGASAAVYLGEVLVAGSGPGTNPEPGHSTATSQKLVRPSGIHRSGRLKNIILAVRNDTFVASFVPGITSVGGGGYRPENLGFRV